MKHPTLKTITMTASLCWSLTSMAAPTLIQHVRVFDGERMLPARSVMIDDGKIVDPDYRGHAPASATLIDGTGRTLLPGLIDAHVHAYRYFDLPLLFGVTTQVDMFTSVSAMQEMSRKMRTGANHGQADLFSAGTLATAPGGHGTEYGMAIPTLSTPAEAQAFVDARIAEGSHFIKIVIEHGQPGHAMASLDSATVKALIDAAHRRGKLAVVHISTLADARAALQAGADGLAHLFLGRAISPDELAGFVTLVKAHKVFVVPTLTVLESMAGMRSDDVLSDASFTALLDREQSAPLKASFNPVPSPSMLTTPMAVTAALQRAGVRVLAGTDAGNVGTQYGISLHHELAALVHAGLTPLQALAAATSAPAQAFRLGQRGRIARGYQADLLLVEGDPGTDIGATRRIVEVWKNGEPASSLRARRIAQLRDAASAKATPLALPADGRISDFTAARLGSPFGLGWGPSDDTIMGGKSKALLALVDGGPDAQQALEVDATVAAGFAYPWAGLIFVPGAQPMQPADLSAARVLRFKVRGDGQPYQVTMLSAGLTIPVNMPFAAGASWQEVALPLASFGGIDPHAVTMISFNAGPAPGHYQFQIADVRLAGQ